MKRYIALMIAALLCVQTLCVCNVAYAAVEPLKNLITNGDMETDAVPAGWAVSSSATGATLSIVTDSENSGNKVLRFDGTNNTGSISYCSNSVTLNNGYYYSFKIRLVEKNTTGNVYLYTQTNAQRQNETDRPKLEIGEWVTVSGYVNASGRKLSLKIVNNTSTSSGSANVTNVIYEIDDVVVCNPADAVEFTPVIIYDGAALHWKSGVVEMDGALYAKADSEASFTLTAPLGFEIDSVTLNGEVLEAVDEVYTFSIPDDLSCVIHITIVEDIGIPHILSVGPENCINMDPEDAVVTVGFDRAMDINSMTEENILVEPSATFTVEEAEADYTYYLIFDELSEATEYSLTFTSGVQTDRPTGLEEEYTFTFTTAQAATNLLENGDMSADTDLYYINSDNSPSYKTLGDERVLYWKIGWENTPINQYVNGDNRNVKYQLLPGHKYYSEAKIMATQDIKVGWRLMYITETDSSAVAHPTSISWITVRAGEWTDVSCLFDQIPSNVLPTSLGYAVRLVAKADSYPVDAYIDDWGLYDCTVAPAGLPELISSAPANGTTNIQPGTLDVTLEFNKPMLPRTAKNIEVTNADVTGIAFSADKKTCVVSLDNIRVNRTITMALKNLSSLAGEAMAEQVISFETKEISTATPVLTVTPDGAVKTHTKGLKMKVISDLPIDGPVDRASVTSVPDNLIERLEWSDSNPEVIEIVLNQAVLTPGGSYSVTLLPTMKSQAGTSIDEMTIAFETLTVSETVELYQEIVDGDDSAELISFLHTNYRDLNDSDTLFSQVICADDELMEKFITELLGETGGADTAEEIADCVWKTALLTIANESNDESAVEKSVESILSQSDKTGLSYTYTNFLSQEMKEELPQKILNNPGDFATVDDYIYFVEKEIILNAFKNSNGWETVSDIFNQNKNFFDSATKTLIDNVNASAYKEQIYNSLQGMNVSNEGEVYTKLKAAYDAKYSSGSSGSGSGGSSSSSSGGGAGFVVSAPVTDANQGNVVEDKTVFTDIDSVSWAKGAIEYLYDLKVINGKTEDLFYPNDLVKREEFVKMIVIAANIPFTNQSVNYTDVSESEWFYPYVAAASACGLINGIGNNIYGVGQNITRQDIAVLCSRLLVNAEEPLKDEIVNFMDSNEISEYAVKSVDKVAYLGLMIGNENQEFSPKAYATRAETAVILQRLIALLNQYATN